MPQSLSPPLLLLRPADWLWLERIPADVRRRVGGVLLVLLMHILLALLLLSLAPPIVQKKFVDMVMFSVSMPDEKTPSKAEEKPSGGEPKPTPPQVTPPKPAPPKPQVPKPPVIELPPVESTTAIETVPVPAPPSPPAPPAQPAPPKRVYGPPDLRQNRGTPDSERVDGAGPNGEPVYAASWFREPYDDELAGFLSTVTSPTGYGTVICQTAEKYRVQNCEIYDEYPRGSGFGRSVLAASWQFLVRPPQIGGKPQVGEWVRIRIYRDGSGKNGRDRWGSQSGRN